MSQKFGDRDRRLFSGAAVSLGMEGLVPGSRPSDRRLPTVAPGTVWEDGIV